MSNHIDNLNNALSVLRDEYQEHVQSIAADFVAEIGDDYQSRESLYDGVHERCDSDQWVIYTTRAQIIALVSDSSGAVVDDFGAEVVVSDGEINWSVIACAALIRDVHNALPALADDEEIFELATAMHDAGIKPGDGETLAEMSLAWQENYIGSSDAEDWFKVGVVGPELANELDAVGVDPSDSDHAPVIASVVTGTMNANDAGQAVQDRSEER